MRSQLHKNETGWAVRRICMKMVEKWGKSLFESQRNETRWHRGGSSFFLSDFSTKFQKKKQNTHQKKKTTESEEDPGRRLTCQSGQRKKEKNLKQKIKENKMTRRVDVLNWTLPVSSSSFLLLLLLLLLLQRRTTEQETGGSCSFSDDAGHLDDKRATTHTHTHTHTHTYTHTNSEDRLRVAQPPTLGVPFKQSASRGGYGGGAVGTWFWLFLKKKTK